MKKNITIITWIGNGNYGTSLQSFSLVWYLKRKGYNTSIVQISPFQKGWRHSVKVFLYRLGLLNVIKWYGKSRLKGKKAKLNSFISKYYDIPTLITPTQISKFKNETDVFLTGSDQIWNTFFRYDSFMFLDFNTPARKVAYASSMGTNEVKKEYEDSVRKNLLDFKYIGVREKDAVRTLSALTGRDDIVQVLDPTFLIDSDSWHEIASDAQIDFEVPEKYIFCYLIANNDFYMEQMKDIQGKTGIDTIVMIPSDESPDFVYPDAIRYDDAGPLEFVRLIEKASMICTDSFHATALSINLGKEFIELLRFRNGDPKSQNSRIYNILDHYGLKERIYQKGTDRWLNTINYYPVHQMLAEDRLFSETFLKESLQ